jgi:hypothetical protein
MVMMHWRVALITAVAVVGHAGTLFQDNFSALGTQLNLAAWTTEIGPSSFLGRTQLADWVTPGGVGHFVVGTDGAHLALNTFNPTDPAGSTFYGTQAETLMSFLPSANTAIVFTTRLQLTSLQPGIVYGMYFYGCVPAACATNHDEIDIELVTNLLQPGASPLQVQLNRYANEPLGAGNGVLVNLPAGFNPLAPHDWTIRWSLTRIDYLVDGVLLFSTTTHVPQGFMQVNEDAWAPASDWSTAYSPLLQPASSAAQNQSFVALLTSVSVTTPINVGVFRSGFLWLLDADGNQQFNAPPDKIYAFGGIPGDIPITGDWSGSGTTKVGVYRSSNGLFILDYDGDGQFTSADKVYSFGVGTQPGDIPVVGDWNGDGRTKIGLFRQGFFWILDTNGNGTFDTGDQSFAYGGIPGDVPIVGDWNGSGTSKVGIFRAGFLWILDTNGNHTVDAGDQVFPFGGITGDVPVVGDWNGDGRTKVGVFRMGFFWVLDTNGNQVFDAGTDQAFAFGGITGDIPVVGKW